MNITNLSNINYIPKEDPIITYSSCMDFNYSLISEVRLMKFFILILIIYIIVLKKEELKKLSTRFIRLFDK